MSVLSCYFRCICFISVHFTCSNPLFKQVFSLKVMQMHRKECVKHLSQVLRNRREGNERAWRNRKSFHQFLLLPLWSGQHSYADRHRLSQQLKARVRGPPAGSGLMMKCWPGIRFVQCNGLCNHGKCKRKTDPKTGEKDLLMFSAFILGSASLPKCSFRLCDCTLRSVQGQHGLAN